MPSINEVIARVEKVKPGAFEDDAKGMWLLELEGKLYREVILEHCGDAVEYPQSFPKDGDMPLLVPAPYDNLYDLYLFAMIDFHAREIANYNNSLMVFNAALDEWKKQYHRTHMPISHGGIII